jgi:DNA-binding CsgD family transcriptional regulator
MKLTIRRRRIKDLAYQGLTRSQIQQVLNLSYATVTQDLKLMGITPVPARKIKENA